jgi:hypothetical protein
MKKEVVKEFLMNDGIGAQMWRKLYAMSFAYENDLVFDDTPITDFLIHESDNINTEDEKNKTIKDFFGLIKNPWEEIKFLDSDEYELCLRVGAGLKDTQGMVREGSGFLKSAVNFSNISGKNNSIVIHVRRGNITKENPRWIDDSIYDNILDNINLLVDKFNMDNPEIIILTDEIKSNKMYVPMNQDQSLIWARQGIPLTDDGGYMIYSSNFESIANKYPNVKIINNLNTIDSFLLMARSEVLIVSRSAFSQCAGLLSKNNVIGMFNSANSFANQKGVISKNGNIVLY